MKYLKNQIFAYLTVLERDERFDKKGSRSYWRCKCVCGKETSVITNRLVTGHTKSCGCMNKNINIGQKFGLLTVINRISYVQWNCLCECGKTKITNSGQLRSGSTSSCGCINNRKKNKSSHWRGFGEISQDYMTSIKRGARVRNLEFSITIEEMWGLFLKQDRKCSLSGIDLVFDSQKTRGCTASLDRIDSKKGYVSDNIQWVHKDINKMKMDFGQDRFIEMCKLVVVNQQVEK